MISGSVLKESIEGSPTGSSQAQTPPNQVRNIYKMGFSASKNLYPLALILAVSASVALLVYLAIVRKR